MKLAAIMLGTVVLLAISSSAMAEPSRANGGACDSTGTARRDGKDQNGNRMNCQFDTCTYSECGTGSGSISNCVKKTEYSNPTDCHPARIVNQSLFNPNIHLQQLESPKGPKVDPSTSSLSSFSGGAAPAYSP